MPNDATTNNLKLVFGFTDVDLHANRYGYLSKNQHKRLLDNVEEAQIRISTHRLNTYIAMGGGIAIILLSMILGIPILAMPVFLMTYFGVRWRRYKMSQLRKEHSKAVLEFGRNANNTQLITHCGVITKVTANDGFEKDKPGGIGYYLIFPKGQAEVSRKQFETVVEDNAYCVYLTIYKQKVLSIDLLDEDGEFVYQLPEAVTAIRPEPTV